MDLLMRLQIGIRRMAIRLALRRAAPNEIPLSGPRVRKRNYCSVYLRGSANGWRLSVQGMSPKGRCGTWFGESGGPGWPASAPNGLIAKCQTQIVLYFREMEIHYASAPEFIVHQIVFYKWLWLWRERAVQYIFNRKMLVRSERISVLRLFFDESVKDYGFGASAADVMTLLCGNRWALHPDSGQQRHYYMMLLDSLVESDDLVSDGYAFRVGPRALTTLAQFEEDNRKHRDMVRMQAILASLTAALVAVGIIQAIVVYLSG